MAVFSAAALAVSAAACSWWGGEDFTHVRLRFNETNVTVHVGGYASLSLEIEPIGAIGPSEISYATLNENIATVFRSDGRGVTFMGRAEGSTVVEARAGGARAMAVVNVVEAP